MSEDRLSEAEKQALLHIAREALEQGVRGEKLPPLDLATLTPRLKEPGASFITLNIRGGLRGCIGALEPYQPLAQDVREHTLAAALDDPRFTPVRPEELDQIEIEVSRLTVPEKLEYKDAQDLLAHLHPHLDGLVLRDGPRRATFLPQVWEKIPDKSQFLDNLCYKMGLAADTWRRKHLEAFVYHVEEFGE
jgi:AmmeMemoRadiSam system protein A